MRLRAIGLALVFGVGCGSSAAGPAARATGGRPAGQAGRGASGGPALSAGAGNGSEAGASGGDEPGGAPAQETGAGGTGDRGRGTGGGAGKARTSNGGRASSAAGNVGTVSNAGAGGEAENSAGAGGEENAGASSLGGLGDTGASGGPPVASAGAGGGVTCECTTGQCCDGCRFRPSSYFLGELPFASACSGTSAVCPSFGKDIEVQYSNLFCTGDSADGTRWYSDRNGIVVTKTVFSDCAGSWAGCSAIEGGHACVSCL